MTNVSSPSLDVEGMLPSSEEYSLVRVIRLTT